MPFQVGMLRGTKLAKVLCCPAHGFAGCLHLAITTPVQHAAVVSLVSSVPFPRLLGSRA